MLVRGQSVKLGNKSYTVIRVYKTKVWLKHRDGHNKFVLIDSLPESKDTPTQLAEKMLAEVPYYAKPIDYGWPKFGACFQLSNREVKFANLPAGLASKSDGAKYVGEKLNSDLPFVVAGDTVLNRAMIESVRIYERKK
mgnify:CR=1 FL=1